jgi:hypothetical protein
VFRPAAGTFVVSETITLSVQAKADIHYTLDGSLPTAVSTDLQGARHARQVDAAEGGCHHPGPATRGGSGDAPAGGVLQGPVATEIYLRVSPDTQGFTSHLPIILIHTFESRALGSVRDRPRSSGHPGAGADIGEKPPGRPRSARCPRRHSRPRPSTRRFPKKQYALELRADDGDADSDRPLLGLPSNADWVLSDSIAYDRSLIRNALAFALSNRIGRYAPHTRFAEVFMVDDGGDVRADSFLGFFTLIERIARDPDRVNVSRLLESAATPPRSPAGSSCGSTRAWQTSTRRGSGLQFVYPKPEEMKRPERQPQFNFIRGFVDDFGRAVSAANFSHPATGQHYSAFIDVDAWIDHHIINALAKNVDGLRFSAYFHKERGGRLAAGPVWDFDRSFGTPYDPRAAEPEEWKLTWSDATDYFTEGGGGTCFAIRTSAHDIASGSRRF